jgi:hypothetical protein
VASPNMAAQECVRTNTRGRHARIVLQTQRARPPIRRDRRQQPYDLRVKRYFPHVKDFERTEKGDIVWESLKGPERIEVRPLDGRTPQATEFQRAVTTLRSLSPSLPPAAAPLAQARQQFSRERIVAGAELKLLQERLWWCYHANGVNHYEECKSIVEAIKTKVTSPYYGMPGAPSRER